MEVTPSGRVISVKDVQPSNKVLGRVVSFEPSSNMNRVRAVHLANALMLNEVTVLGISNELMAVPENAFGPMDVIPSGRSMCVRFLHPENVFDPMDFADAGHDVISVMPAPWKAPLPMARIFAGRFIAFRLVQNPKGAAQFDRVSASHSKSDEFMVVKDSGSNTSARSAHRANVPY